MLHFVATEQDLERFGGSQLSVSFTEKDTFLKIRGPRQRRDIAGKQNLKEVSKCAHHCEQRNVGISGTKGIDKCIVFAFIEFRGSWIMEQFAHCICSLNQGFIFDFKKHLVFCREQPDSLEKHKVFN